MSPPLNVLRISLAFLREAIVRNQATIDRLTRQIEIDRERIAELETALAAEEVLPAPAPEAQS